MTLVLALKIVHILSAVVALGANVTYAFWMRQAGTKDRERLVFTIASIRKLDNLIATPAYVVVLLTGLGMVFSGAFSFSAGWIQAAIVLYVLAVVVGIFVYAPTIKRQLAAAEADPTSDEYRALASRANVIGIVEIFIVVVIVVLMVTKPF